jgi:hypothetical protein
LLSFVVISAGGGGDGQAQDIVGCLGLLALSPNRQGAGRPVSGGEPMDALPTTVGARVLQPCTSSQPDQIDGSSRRQYSPSFLRLLTRNLAI